MKIDWKSWGIGFIAAIIILAIALMFLQSTQNIEFKVIDSAGRYVGTIAVPVNIPLSGQAACTVATAAFKLSNEKTNMSDTDLTCRKLTIKPDGIIEVSDENAEGWTDMVADINESAKTVMVGYAL